MRRIAPVILVCCLVLAGCAATPASTPTHNKISQAEIERQNQEQKDLVKKLNDGEQVADMPTSEATPENYDSANDPGATMLTITFYGTAAAFTWSDESGMHQVQQDGPYTVTMPWTPGSTFVNANAVSMSKDAGCTVTNQRGTVLMDNRAPGQTMASCAKQF